MEQDVSKQIEDVEMADLAPVSLPIRQVTWRKMLTTSTRMTWKIHNWSWNTSTKFTDICVNWRFSKVCVKTTSTKKNLEHQFYQKCVPFLLIGLSRFTPNSTCFKRHCTLLWPS